MTTAAPPRTPARPGLARTPRLRRAVMWCVAAPFMVVIGWALLSLIAWHVLPEPEPYPNTVWLCETAARPHADPRLSPDGPPVVDWRVGTMRAVGTPERIDGAMVFPGENFTRKLRTLLEVPTHSVGCARPSSRPRGRVVNMDGETWVEFSNH